MKFKASMDNMAKIVTAGIAILFLFLIIGQFTLLKEVDTTTSIITIVLLMGIYIVPFLLRPIDYRVESNQVKIHRLVSDVKIDKDSILSVQVLDDGALNWSIRTFGVGGLFGYFGKFANSKLGNMTWYATRRNKAVIIQTNNKKIIVTPDEPQRFVESVILSLAQNLPLNSK